jgi:RNA polymerase sigma-70 factor (ECF subfamily)
VDSETGRTDTASAKADSLNDAAVVARVAASERDALAQLYSRYGAVLLRYLLQLTPDRTLAEEILQDTLLAVWKQARTYEGRSSVRTWVFGIARRQAHNHLRQRAVVTDSVDVLEQMPSPDPDPQDALLTTIAREELAEALGGLVPTHREVLLLVLIDELSYEEAAEVLGVPVGTVKSRLHHARLAMRERLAQRREQDR